MLPKKAAVRLRRSEVFFLLAYHAIVANQVVTFALVLVWSIDRVVLISDKVSRSTTLFT